MSDTKDPALQQQEGAAASQAEPTSPAQSEPSKAGGGKGALTISILALLLAGGVGGAGYWGWQQIETRLAGVQQSTQQSLQSSEQSFQQLEQQLRQQVEQSLSKQTAQGTQLQQNLTEALQAAELENQQLIGRTEALSEQVGNLQGKLLEISGRRPSDWLLAEANHLVRLAGRKLWLEDDTVTAMALLASADERIRELNDPSLLPLRESLAQDIATLKALPQLDSEGLALRLSSLQQKVSELKPLTLELPESINEQPDFDLSESVADWKQNLQKVWSQISADFVTVQRRSGPVAPLLSPKQHWYLQENVRNKLIQAQQALLDHQPELYQQALTDAQSWISEFYQPEDYVTQFMLDEIGELAQVNIVLERPDALATQKPLEDLIRERVQALIQTKAEGAS